MTEEENQSFFLKANSSSQLIDSMINGRKVQKKSRYGEPVQMLMSDMK